MIQNINENDSEDFSQKEDFDPSDTDENAVIHPFY
jgi:hypothetical protein